MCEHHTENTMHYIECAILLLFLYEVTMLPIIIVLTEGFSDWEIAPLSGLGRAFYGADIRFVSPDGGPLTSIGGLTISDTERFECLTQGVVVVCGGPVFERDSSPDFSDRLHTTHANGCVVAGICAGTAALARAKLLNDVKHTSNGPGYLQGLVPHYTGATMYVDQPFALRDAHIITAPAPAPASFAVEVMVAAGLALDAADELKNMLAREHTIT